MEYHSGRFQSSRSHQRPKTRTGLINFLCTIS
jgi:hypothetical protein